MASGRYYYASTSCSEERDESERPEPTTHCPGSLHGFSASLQASPLGHGQTQLTDYVSILLTVRGGVAWCCNDEDKPLQTTTPGITKRLGRISGTRRGKICRSQCRWTTASINTPIIPDHWAAGVCHARNLAFSAAVHSATVISARTGTETGSWRLLLSISPAEGQTFAAVTGGVATGGGPSRACLENGEATF
jgi:hypothetical protein